MKILLATGLYPPEIGGPATYSKLLFTELPKQGIAVSVLPFSFVRHYPKVVRHLMYFGKLVRASKTADVIYAQDPVSVGFPALCAAWVCRKPLMLRIAGDYAWEQSAQRWGVTDSIDEFQTKTYGFQVEALRSLQKFVVRHATLTVTPSEYFRKLVTAWNTQSGPVVTIYNGLNFPELPKPKNKPSAEKWLVSAGRLVPWKNFSELIDTMDQFPPEWKLIILGDGPLRSELAQRIVDLKLEQRVQLCGAVDRQEMFAWLQAADVFVLNATFESFSFQTVEALYAGAPVVANAIGNLSEIITSDAYGRLVPAHDTSARVRAILDLAHDTEVRQRCIVAGKQRALDFSIEKTLSELVTALQTYVFGNTHD